MVNVSFSHQEERLDLISFLKSISNHQNCIYFFFFGTKEKSMQLPCRFLYCFLYKISFVYKFQDYKIMRGKEIKWLVQYTYFFLKKDRILGTGILYTPCGHLSRNFLIATKNLFFWSCNFYPVLTNPWLFEMKSVTVCFAISEL